jgi:hypothetical protein
MQDHHNDYERRRMLQPEDEADEEVERQRRLNRLMERAEELRERGKDERAEKK